MVIGVGSLYAIPGALVGAFTWTTAAIDPGVGASLGIFIGGALIGCAGILVAGWLDERKRAQEVQGDERE